MGMNEALAEYFGGNKQAADETQVWAENFVKAAAEQGVDLTQFDDAQVEGMFGEWQQAVLKQAEEACKEEASKDEEKAKLEKAKKEHEEKKAAAAQVEEAQLMGQIIGQSFWNTVKEAADAEQKANLARRGYEAVKGVAGKAINALGKEDIETGKANRAFGRWARDEQGKHSMGQNAINKGTKQIAKGVAKATGAATAAGVGLAGGGYAAYKGLKKDKPAEEKKEGSDNSSAFDDYAAELAVQKVAEAGFDPDQAAFRIAALFEFGAQPELDKVAQVQDTGLALEIRSLELAQAAGYPVEWNQ